MKIDKIRQIKMLQKIILISTLLLYFLISTSVLAVEIITPTSGQKIILPSIPVKGEKELPCEENPINWKTTIEGNEYTTQTNFDEGGSINVTTFPNNNSSFGPNKVCAKASSWDIIPPVIEFSGAEDGKKYCSEIAVSYKATDVGCGIHKVIATSTTCSPSSSDKIEDTFTCDKDCNQLVSVIAEDKAGNRTGPEKINFEIDLTPPKTSLSGPSGVIILKCLGRCGPAEGCRDVSYAISGSDNKDPANMICFDTNLPIPSKCISPQTASWCIGPGAYLWYAWAVDTCGHKELLPKLRPLAVIPPPSCDCPDEAETVATFSPNPQETDGEPSIAVFDNGLGEYVENLLSVYKEPTKLLADISPLSEFKKYKALFMPAGGLIGLERSEIIKTILDEYVKGGGIILSFTQQHGYEFSALPTGKVSGYGWAEDQSCHSNAAQIDEYHQILTSQKDIRFDGGIDGYFSMWPEGTKILLRRTKNNMPAMILYPYGQGYVIATTLYSDFSYAQGSITEDEMDLMKDIITC